jgi:GcrA cell cycle regulator
MPFRVSASGVVSYSAPTQFTGFIHAGTWADERRVERLKELWAEGLSARTIAAELGEGVSRNAVIGKVHRLGLAGRVTVFRAPRRVPERSAPRARSATARPPRAYPQPVILSGAPEAKMLPFGKLKRSTCHWPIGDPLLPGFGFCGHATVPGGQPYCAHHQCKGHQSGRAAA